MEAWGKREISMVIGIPNTNLVTIHWALNLSQMWKPEGLHIRAWSGLPIDVARNAIVEEARRLKAKYVLFLDSDVVARRQDWIKVLMDVNQPIVSALYYSKKGSPGMWREDETGGYIPIEKSGTNLIEVDAVGAGALLIDMRVFDELDKQGLKPYFVWEIDDPAHMEHKASEDFHFCKLCRKAGFSILVYQGIEMLHEQLIAWGPNGEIAQFND